MELAPNPGQSVYLRRRPALVRDVHAQKQGVELGRPQSHLVEVEYLDGWHHPRVESVIWEIETEFGARVLSRIRLPDIGDQSKYGSPDFPARFDAFIDAIRWGHAAHHAVLTPAESQHLLAPWHASVQVEDYQLYPLWKSLLMPRVSLLLADDVGLGKTIEAGLILTELLQRRSLRRVLVVCPATLQQQWKEELEQKFNLRFTILDSKECARIQREQGSEVNPWAVTPRAITSMSYLAQEEVKERFRSASQKRAQSAAAGACPWDVLIVDEAHHFAPSRAGGESLRTRMLRELNVFFEHRLFLTATPHNGFTWSFTGLLELLNPVRFHQDSELSSTQIKHRDAVMVRRLKSDLNTDKRQRFAERHVKEFEVQLGPEESMLFEALRTYRDVGLQRFADEDSEARRARQQARFLFSMLSKRLLSSSFAFARTWWQHIEGYQLPAVSLNDAEAARKTAEEGSENEDEVVERELEAVRQTSAWMAHQSAGAITARDAVTTALEQIGWTKERVSKGLPEKGKWLPVDARFAGIETWIDEHLRENKEWRDDERLILFTEYKDTLAYILWRLRRLGHDDPEIQHLFGGQSLDHREGLKRAFNDIADPVRILAATDAASEGLNLQETCRYVFHFDIPWNPMRMEQRNGRVDRYGQLRDVSCYHFTTRDESDIAFLGRIAWKLNEARADLGSVGDILARSVEERFTHGLNPSDSDISSRIVAAHEGSEATKDMADSDAGSESDYLEVLGQLHDTEHSLGLNPRALARLLQQAMKIEGGELKGPDGNGEYRLAKQPSTWRTLISQHLLLKRGASEGALPRISFDPSYFEKKHDGRRVYRPKPNVALLRLGHPLMQRALAVLQRAMWEDTTGKSSGVQRWTVRQASLASGIEALVKVHVLSSGTNQLRETIEAQLSTQTFELRNGEWRHFTADLPRDCEDLPASQLGTALDEVRESWFELTEILGEHLSDEDQQHRDSLQSRLIVCRAQEEDKQKQRFKDRAKELQAQQSQSTSKRREESLRRLKMESAASLFKEMKQSLELEISELENQDKRNFELLEQTLKAEKLRLLKEVIPRRYDLARAEVMPVAIEVIVPEVQA